MYKKELIDTLLAEIIKHTAVNSVSWGSEFDVNINGKTLYPYVFIESEASQLTFGGNVNEHTIALYFLDIHAEDSEIEVKDKQRITEEIMYEVVEYLDNDVANIFIDKEGLNAISLREYNSDVLAGWRLDISFLVNPPLNRCDYESKFV